MTSDVSQLRTKNSSVLLKAALFVYCLVRAMTSGQLSHPARHVFRRLHILLTVRDIVSELGSGEALERETYTFSHH